MSVATKAVGRNVYSHSVTGANKYESQILESCCRVLILHLSGRVDCTMNAANRLNINGTPSTSEEGRWLCAMVRRPLPHTCSYSQVQGITLMLDFFFYSYFQKHYFKFQEQRRHTFQRIRTVWQPRAAANSGATSSTLLSTNWGIGACTQNRGSTPASCVENNETEISVRQKDLIMPLEVVQRQ